MGNKIARTTQVSASEYYLHDLPSSYNLVLIEVLGRGRFFKSILCKHDEGLVLVKVYFKRGDLLDLKVPVSTSSLRALILIGALILIDALIGKFLFLVRSMRGDWPRLGKYFTWFNIRTSGRSR